MAARRSAADRLPRTVSLAVTDALDGYPCVGVFGPRQVGKSTLARQVAEPLGEGAVVLDLGDPTSQAALADEVPFFAKHLDKLIVLDELQRAPALVEVVRRRVEMEIHSRTGTTRFLISGSSRLDLQRLCADALGSRLRPVTVGPLHILDLLDRGARQLRETVVPMDHAPPQEVAIAPSNAAFDPARLWLRGGFPLSYLALSEAESVDWRRTYVGACAAQEAPDTSAGALRRTLDELAADPGGKRAVRSGPPDFRACVEHLTQLGLVRQLPAWAGSPVKRLAKEPKLYIRDTGLLHALRRCASYEELIGTPGLLGGSWESFCIEQLVVAAGERAQAFYYRREEGEEIDLVLVFSGDRRWGIEIKRDRDPSPTTAFETACRVIGAERKIYVSGAAERGPVRRGVDILSLCDAVLAVSQR